MEPKLLGAGSSAGRGDARPNVAPRMPAASGSGSSPSRNRRSPARIASRFSSRRPLYGRYEAVSAPARSGHQTIWMCVGRRPHWRDPRHWRWWWRHRVSVDAKIILVVTFMALGLIAYLFARAPDAPRKADDPRKAATLTPPRVSTVVPRTGANASADVVIKSRSTSRAADVRMAVLSVTPRPPQAARPFALVARVAFAPAPGSIRCSVWIGGEQYRKVRLVWESPIARCFGHVPEGARGSRLQIALSAVLGGSRTQTTVGFTVS